MSIPNGRYPGRRRRRFGEDAEFTTKIINKSPDHYSVRMERVDARGNWAPESRAAVDRPDRNGKYRAYPVRAGKKILSESKDFTFVGEALDCAMAVALRDLRW